MEKEATGKLSLAYVVFKVPCIGAKPELMGVFSTRLQALGFIEEECSSGYIEARNAFLFDDSPRVLLLEQRPPMELVTDYPEPKQVRIKKLSKSKL